METIMDRSIDIGKLIPQPDDDVIVCRCEEVTKGEIRQAAERHPSRCADKLH